MADYVTTTGDDGGVHINVGHPQPGLLFRRRRRLGGYAGSSRPDLVRRCDNRLITEPSFEEFARLTTDVAGQLYGASSAEQQAVADAWAQVGVVKVA